jgi:hypothetical protein
MRIVGEWLACNDGVTRPTLEARVQAADGSLLRCAFLIDSGADRTVLAADLLEDLGFNATPAHQGMTLQGITGECGFVVVRTVVELRCDDGAAANMRGEFAAFTDPSATDMSILGRDILNKFDVILSHQRDEVLLLAMNHRYRVEQV